MESCSTAMLAKLYNLTERRVHQLAKDGIFIRHAHGKYDFIASIRGYTDYLRVMAEKEDEPLKRERQRLVKAQADRIEEENKLRQGQLIELSLVGDLLQDVSVLYAACVDALPGRLAHELTGLSDPAVVKARLFDACRQLRQATAQRLLEFTDLLEAAAGISNSGKSCSAPDAEPVGG